MRAGPVDGPSHPVSHRRRCLPCALHYSRCSGVILDKPEDSTREAVDRFFTEVCVQLAQFAKVPPDLTPEEIDDCFHMALFDWHVHAKARGGVSSPPRGFPHCRRCHGRVVRETGTSSPGRLCAASPSSEDSGPSLSTAPHRACTQASSCRRCTPPSCALRQRLRDPSGCAASSPWHPRCVKPKRST